MRAGEFAIGFVTAACAALAIISAGLLSPAAVLAGALAGAAATLWLARLFARRIQGYTGDCLGAVQQASEVLIYLGILATMQQGAFKALA
jgi:adenosylcobinamide-GDP ribazoletransferase